MKQLEMFCTIKKFTPIEQLARHMRMFRVDFTYDELRDWRKKANKLTRQVNEIVLKDKSK